MNLPNLWLRSSDFIREGKKNNCSCSNYCLKQKHFNTGREVFLLNEAGAYHRQ